MATVVLVEKLFAGAVVCVCLALLLRPYIKAPWLLRLETAIGRHARRLQRGIVQLWRWPGVRRRARREAQAAIRKARDGGAWEGNVYRPKSMSKPRKLH
jgi:hypothetical protein